MDGTIVAMAPTTGVHGAIGSRLGHVVGGRLRPPCMTINDAGIFLPHRNDAFYVADVAITCTLLRSGVIGIENPLVIFEILSPSTARDDRRAKVPDYREIPSVQEIVLLSSSERRAELYVRRPHGWALTDLRSGDELRLASVDIAVSLDALYDGIPL
jgi:Uma2 family endonuclease